jgi:hypothetical protein
MTYPLLMVLPVFALNVLMPAPSYLHFLADSHKVQALWTQNIHTGTDDTMAANHRLREGLESTLEFYRKVYYKLDTGCKVYSSIC